MLNLAALREFACVRSPSTQIPASTLLTYDDKTIAIFDAFPKAKYHFLVLPRYPFPTTAAGSTVRLNDLESLSSVITRPSYDVAREVITAMADMAKEVEEMIQDEMMKTEGFVWGVDMGFHAVPSMQSVVLSLSTLLHHAQTGGESWLTRCRHVHLHVISDDRVSPSLKTKKHFNSFRPDLGFLISLAEVERWLKEDQAFTKQQARVSTP